MITFDALKKCCLIGFKTLKKMMDKIEIETEENIAWIRKKEREFVVWYIAGLRLNNKHSFIIRKGRSGQGNNMLHSNQIKLIWKCNLLKWMYLSCIINTTWNIYLKCIPAESVQTFTFLAKGIKVDLFFIWISQFGSCSFQDSYLGPCMQKV